MALVVEALTSTATELMRGLVGSRFKWMSDSPTLDSCRESCGRSDLEGFSKVCTGDLLSRVLMTSSGSRADSIKISFKYSEDSRINSGCFSSWGCEYFDPRIDWHTGLSSELSDDPLCTYQVDSKARLVDIRIKHGQLFHGLG